MSRLTDSPSRHPNGPIRICLIAWGFRIVERVLRNFSRFSRNINEGRSWWGIAWRCIQLDRKTVGHSCRTCLWSLICGSDKFEGFLSESFQISSAFLHVLSSCLKLFFMLSYCCSGSFEFKAPLWSLSSLVRNSAICRKRGQIQCSRGSLTVVELLEPLLSLPWIELSTCDSHTKCSGFVLKSASTFSVACKASS